MNKDVKFKIDNFDSETMQEIQTNWEKIKESIRSTFIFIKNIGLNNYVFSSNYPAAILAYYIFKNNFKNNQLLNLDNFEDIRTEMREFVIKALLKQLFSTSLDTVLINIRKCVVEKNCLKISEVNSYVTVNKRVSFSDEDIDTYLELGYGDKQLSLVLFLLYPEINLTNYFHIDHLIPISKFTKANLSKLKIDQSLLDNYRYNANTISNLHLLEGNQNISKNDTMPEDWLLTKFNNDKTKIELFKNNNYISLNTPMLLENFENYFNERKTLLRERLEKILAKVPTPSVAPAKK